MSFIEKLPTTYKNLRVQLWSTQIEAESLWRELGASDEYSYHDCDCEYCPVPELPELTAVERHEKTEKAEKLDELIDEYKTTIRSVEGYAKLVKVELPGLTTNTKKEEI